MKNEIYEPEETRECNIGASENERIKRYEQERMAKK